MLDIEAELEEAREKFISLGELADFVYSCSRKTAYSSVAEWLLMKLNALDKAEKLPRLVSINHFSEIEPVHEAHSEALDIMELATNLLDLKSKNCLPYTYPPEGECGEYWASDSFDRLGFEREKIADCLPDKLKNVIIAKVEIPSDLMESAQEAETPIADSSFRGKETLLDIIAGQAITIGKISGKHTRITGINKSALVRDIFAAISDYGKGMSVDDRQARAIITEAITLRTSKIISSEQLINLAAEREAQSGSTEF